MYPSGHTGASAYARVDVETGVMGANSHRLIVMLYQGARQAIAQARLHLRQNNVGPRCEAVSKAIRIVDNGLRTALNLEAGDEIARRLDALYGYMAKRLYEANATQSEPMLMEVDRLLATLEEAWLGIAPEVAKAAAQKSPERMR
jgi:flagellar protein FliS